MITVKYSCPECGLKNVEVQVPARDDPNEEAVVPWVRDVMIPTVCKDHLQRSPRCNVKELKDVMVPMEGAEFIGQQVE